MASKPAASQKLEISVEAVADSRGGYYPVIWVGEKALNLNANTYETVEEAFHWGNQHFALFIELALKNSISNSYL